MVRYYSTQRPIGPGTYPCKEFVIEIVNFDCRQYVEEIGRNAWGYIEYSQELPADTALSYELVKIKDTGEKMFNVWIYDSESGWNEPVTFLAKNKTVARALGRKYIKAWQLKDAEITKIEEVSL